MILKIFEKRAFPLPPPPFSSYHKSDIGLKQVVILFWQFG